MNNKTFTLIEKITNYLLNILMFIFGFILLISIYTGVQTKMLGSKYADFFGYSFFEVQTGSMANTINPGDWIIVHLTNQVKLNDIITYEVDGEYVTHRLIQAYNGLYTTKGDANNSKDEPIYAKQILGKVIKVFPRFGIIRKTLFNFNVLIALGVTLFLISYALKSKNQEQSSPNPKVLKYINKFNALYDGLKAFIKNKLNKHDNLVIDEVITIPLADKKQIINSEMADEELTDDEVDEELVESPEVDGLESELEKTTMYRVIPVDLSEIGDAFLKEAKQEIASANPKPTPIVIESPTEEVDLEPGLTKINLELLKNKKGRKKGKNIITTFMAIKEEELTELIDYLNPRPKKIANELTVRKLFINSYIDAKYYNLYGDQLLDYNVNNQSTKIKPVIKSLAKQLIKERNKVDDAYIDMVNSYATTFMLIADLDISDLDSSQCIDFLATHREDWDSTQIEKASKKIIKIQKNYQVVLEYFLKKLETNMFSLKLNRLARRKNLHGVVLEHNIAFSKLYSEYIIYKTYTEGIVAEDKMPVLITLLLLQMINDMQSANFISQYFIYLPNTLYAKEKKLAKVLDMLSDEHAKNNCNIVIDYEDLINYKKIIKQYCQLGYHFAVVFNENTVPKKKDIVNLGLADYIFIDKKAKNYEKIMTAIPQSLTNNIFYDDLSEKLEGFGGE